MNDFVAQGRAEKAAKIVSLVEADALASGLDAYGDAEEIARGLRERLGDDAMWLALQRRTGNPRKKPPSLETRELVVETLAKRVDVAGESEDA